MEECRKRPREEGSELDDIRAERIKKLVVSVGQGAVLVGEKLSKQLLGLRHVLCADVEEDGYSEILLRSLLECSCSFGWKAPIYGALVAALPIPFQERVVHGLLEKTEEIAKGRVDFPQQLTVVLRMFCELCNCGVVSLDSLLDLLHIVLDHSLTFQVVRVLPWLSMKERGERLESLIHRIEQASEIDPALAAEVEIVKTLSWEKTDAEALIPEPFRIQLVSEGFTRGESDSPITLDLERVRGLGTLKSPVATAFKKLDLFCPAGKIYVENKASFLEKGEQSGMIQAWDKGGLETAMESISNVNPRHAWILQLYTEEILSAYNPFVREAVEAMLEFCPDTSLDHLLFQIVLGVLLHDCSNTMFVKRVLTVLCESHPARFLMVSEDAVDGVMVLLPQFDASTVDVFADWFSFMLTVEMPRWPWGKWIQLAQQSGISDANEKRREFLDQVVERFIQMNSVDPLARDLPPTLFKSLIPQVEVQFGKFSRNLAVADPKGNKLDKERFDRVLSFFQNKPEEDELLEWTEQNMADVSAEQRLDYMLHVALQVGSPSFTHTSKALARAHAVLKSAISSDVACMEQFVLQLLFQTYTMSWQWKSFVVVCMVRAGLIGAQSVVSMICREGLLTKWQTFQLLAEVLAHPSKVHLRVPSLAKPKVGAFGEVKEEDQVKDSNDQNGEDTQNGSSVEKKENDGTEDKQDVHEDKEDEDSATKLAATRSELVETLRQAAATCQDNSVKSRLEWMLQQQGITK